MDKYQEIKNVVLTPVVPNPRFEMVTEYDHPNFFPYDALAPERLVRDEAIFQLRDWKIEMKVGPTEKFKKVEEILERRFTGAKSYHGGEVTAEILEALGL